MALIFTIDQIKNISKDIILLPDVITNADNSFVQQRNGVLVAKDSLMKTDSDQSVYSDFWIDTITRYHAELKLLNASVRTAYSNSTLVGSGNKNGAHFPSNPIWDKFTPKIVDSNNGQPITTSSDLTELDHMIRLSSLIDSFTNGFNYGSYSNSGTISGNEITLTNVSGASVGQQLLVQSGSSSMIVKIETIIPEIPAQSTPIVIPYSPPKIIFSVLVGTTFNGAVTVQNYFAGFTNAQRAGTVSVGVLLPIFNGYKTSIDDQVNVWEANVNAQKAQLNGNDDLQPRKARNIIALASINTFLAKVAVFEALPTTTVNGRFVDTNLAPILASITSRTADRTARISEINTFLGSVSQAADGSYSGSGVYLDLYRVIDARIAFASGTLFSVNQLAMGVQVFDKKIEAGNNQLAQYRATFALTRILNDTVLGQINFEVDSTVDPAGAFSIGDAVYVLDNASLVYSRTITQINGNFIKLNQGIPAVLTIQALARITKQK